MQSYERYMYRCIELARKGAGRVAPNPMVGSLLVDSSGALVGEGWHQQYGHPHAEVNAINNALQETGDLSALTLFVSLEPCAHSGKTPPCTDLIIKHRIPKVIIGCRDPFEKVNGRGMEKLKAAGVEVICGILERQCRELNKRFMVFQEQHRPYLILKWAQTKDGFMAYPAGHGSRLNISGSYAKRLVHKWRSEEAAILIGTHTALKDDPHLTTRFWPGPSPVRLIVDWDLKLPVSLHVFDHSVRTIVFNEQKNEEAGNLLYYQVSRNTSLVQQIIKALHHVGIQSVLVEGGARLLQSFIDEDCWDELRILTGSLVIENGISAPHFSSAALMEQEVFGEDQYALFQKKK